MLLDLLSGGFESIDWIAFLRELLLRLPAFVLALSMHEAAHAYVANRCGDPTARLMGRLTLNPLKHIDPKGFMMVLLVGIGWAKPVPVNPNNFRNPRRDDLKVSLAGVTANLIMFLFGCIAVFTMLAVALNGIPADAWQDGYFLMPAEDGRYWMVTVEEAFLYSTGMGDILIAPVLGTAWSYVYEIFVNFSVTNLVLFCFNLLPVPPLDGYHVLNDLILRRALFAPEKVARAGQLLLIALVVTGWLSKGLSFIINHVFSGVGAAMNFLYTGFFGG